MKPRKIKNHEWQDGSGLAVFYVAVAVTFAIIWWTPISVHWGLSATEQSIRLDRAPVMSIDEIRAGFAAYIAASAAPVSTDPMEYYRLLASYSRLELAYRRHQRDIGPDFEVAANLVDVNMGVTRSLQQAYSYRFGEEAMSKASEKGGALLDSAPENAPTGVSYHIFWGTMLVAYLQSILLAVFFFVGRLKQCRLNVLVETWRILPMAPAWPVTVFLYPVRVNPLRQIERARQFAIFAFSACMSFFGMTGAAASVQSGAAARRSAPMADVSQYVPSFTVSSQLFSGKLTTNGLMLYRKPVVQANLTASWKSGLALDFAGQHSTSHNDTPSEADATITWRGKNVVVGLADYDVAPPFGEGERNILNPFIEVSTALLATQHHRVAPYARFDYLRTLKGPAANAGTFTTLGVRHHWQLGDGVSADQILWALYDGSVFKSDRGFMGRYKLGVHVPVGHGITVDPLLFEVSFPVSGVHDRGVETLFGCGIGAALN